jgi:repressor LexA
MGYKAVGSAQDVVASLRKKGYLAIPDKQTARCLTLSAKAKEIYKIRPSDTKRERFDSFTVPQLGSVPAGLPVEAIEEHHGSLRISTSLIPRFIRKPERLFALRAKGESMVNAGICDGDWLVVYQQEEAPVGSIVVALLDGDATVKRLMQNEKGIWYLKPENPSFKEVFADQSPFSVIGRVVALQRSYSDFM